MWRSRSSVSRRTLKKLAGWEIVLAKSLLLASTVWAGTETFEAKSSPPVEQACEPPQPYEFRIGIPGWISGLSGDFGVHGVVTDQDVKFTDLLKRLEMIAIGSLYARYQQWEFFADGQYLKLFLLRAGTKVVGRVETSRALAGPRSGPLVLNLTAISSQGREVPIVTMQAFRPESRREPRGRVSITSSRYVFPHGSKMQFHLAKPVNL